MPLSDQEDADGSELKETWHAKAGKEHVVFSTWIKTEEGRAVAAKCGVLDTLESVLQQEGVGADESSSPPSPAASTVADATATSSTMEPRGTPSSRANHKTSRKTSILSSKIMTSKF